MATRQKVFQVQYEDLAHRYCIYCSRLSPENKILNTARTGGLSLSGCFQPSENCCSTTVGEQPLVKAPTTTLLTLFKDRVRLWDRQKPVPFAFIVVYGIGEAEFVIGHL